MEIIIGYLSLPWVKFIAVPVCILVLGEVINRSINTYQDYKDDPIFDPDGVGKVHTAYANQDVDKERKTFRVWTAFTALIVVIFLTKIT